jgi:hypothetical protein
MGPLSLVQLKSLSGIRGFLSIPEGVSEVKEQHCPIIANKERRDLIKSFNVFPKNFKGLSNRNNILGQSNDK